MENLINTKFGFKKLINRQCLDIEIEIENEKIYKLKDLFWLLPLCFFIFFFGFFMFWFYFNFPLQLFWLILVLIVVILI